MDSIQAFLITSGRKDLAQDYFLKLAAYSDLTEKEKNIVDSNESVYVSEFNDTSEECDFYEKWKKNTNNFGIKSSYVKFYYLKNPKDKKLCIMSEHIENTPGKWIAIYDNNSVKKEFKETFAEIFDFYLLLYTARPLPWESTVVKKPQISISNSVLESKAIMAAKSNKIFEDKKEFIDYLES